jgi:ABC-2 type transport system ATP-binding protein
MTSSQTPVISVKQLSREFVQQKKRPGVLGSLRALVKPEYKKFLAVDNISLSIDRGEFVGFIGKNGAGKTTTLKMLSGLLHPTSGSVEVLGYTPFKRQELFLREISMLMGQKSQLWWELPPTDIFKLNKLIYDLTDQEYNDQLNLLLEALDAKDLINIQARKLSLGQRMKCEIIAALLHKPSVLFLDEPTIGLDIITQYAIREFLRTYNKETKATIILTSHNLDDVQLLCPRLIVIDEGKLLYDGKTADLVRKSNDKKILRITFNAEPDQAKLQKYGDFIQESLTTYSISVPTTTHTQIVAGILQDFSVDDIDIQGISLEEIIAEFLKTKNHA